jgi:transposase
MESTVWIGIDISKDFFHAAYRQGEGYCQAEFKQKETSMKDFLEWLPKERKVQIVMESTGPYWSHLFHFLQSQPHPIACSVVNPRKVRDFAKAGGHYSKTDPLDTQVLVHFGETFKPPTLEVQAQAYRELRSLSRHYLQLRRHYDVLRDQRDKMEAEVGAPEAIKESFQDLLQRLEVRMKKIVAALTTALQRRPLRKVSALLLSIPGIGVLTASTLLAEYGLDGLSRSSKEWQSYAGLDVLLWESGSSVHKRPRLSKQGNWRIRRALYMAAISAIQHNPAVRDYHQTRLHRGKEKKEALVASMRKLLCICHGVLKNQSPFEEIPIAA